MKMTKEELREFTGSAIGLFRIVLYKIDTGAVLSEEEFYSKPKEYIDYVLFVSELMNSKSYDDYFSRTMGNFLYSAIANNGIQFKNIYLDLLFWINESIVIAKNGNLGEHLNERD